VIESNKVENKNSFMRKFNTVLLRIMQQDNTSGNKARSRPDKDTTELEKANEAIKQLLIETQFMNEFTQHSNPQL